MVPPAQGACAEQTRSWGSELQSERPRLTQDKRVSLWGLLRPEARKEILKVARHSDNRGGNADGLEVLLHHAFAIEVGHLEAASRQLLDVLQAAVHYVAQTQALRQISQPLPLREVTPATRRSRAPMGHTQAFIPTHPFPFVPPGGQHPTHPGTRSTHLVLWPGLSRPGQVEQSSASTSYFKGSQTLQLLRQVHKPQP